MESKQVESKQVLQTAILIALVIFGLLYSYIEFLVDPLKKERDRLQTSITSTQAEIASNGNQLRKLLSEEETEKQNARLDRLTDRMLKTTPAVPQVECPLFFSKWMARHDMRAGKPNISAYQPLRGIKEGILQSWTLKFPAVKPFALGEAIADLENQLPMAQVSDLTLERNPTEKTVRAETVIQFVTLR